MGSLEKRFPRYSRILKFYPLAYRQEYGEQMLQTLADMLDHAGSSSERRAVWLRAILDLPLSIAKQQLITTGGSMTRETPGYVKHGSLAGAILLLPFFMALAANGLNKVIDNQDLYHSWLWSAPVLFTWVLLLPTLAFLVGSYAFLRWAAEQRQRGKVSAWKLIADWRRNWPMLGVLIVSFGIVAMVFGHDSVHCVTGNPVKEARNWHATWRCIKTG